MDISLTDEQETWLRARVVAGEFASMQEAVGGALDEAMVRFDGGDDLDWAKPLIEEAERSIAECGVITLEDHRAHTAALLARLGVK